MMASSTSQMLAILRMEIPMDPSAPRSELQAMLTNGEISVDQYQESYQRQVVRAHALHRVDERLILDSGQDIGNVRLVPHVPGRNTSGGDKTCPL